MGSFYDELTDVYHLVYEDWDAAIERQAGQLAAIIRERWNIGPDAAILDVSCGIGTQSLGLARLGFRVCGSDASRKAIERAREEAKRRGLDIRYRRCDMRKAYEHHSGRYAAVISCDNSIAHLLTDDEILDAFRSLYRCAAPGGGCLVTVRDYDREERGRGLIKLYGTREEEGRRTVVFQVWDFEGEICEVSLYMVVDTGDGAAPMTRVLRAKCYAVGIDRLLGLLAAAGFGSVERLDGRFFQPVLVGTKPPD